MSQTSTNGSQPWLGGSALAQSSPFQPKVTLHLPDIDQLDARSRRILLRAVVGTERCGSEDEDFYEAFNEDAQVCAIVLDLAITKTGNLLMVGFPDKDLAGHLRTFLQSTRHRIAIMEKS